MSLKHIIWGMGSSHDGMAHQIIMKSMMAVLVFFFLFSLIIMGSDRHYLVPSLNCAICKYKAYPADVSYAPDVMIYLLIGYNRSFEHAVVRLTSFSSPFKNRAPPLS